MGWVPAPRYVLRRYCALKLARRLPRGRFLELGCGAGDLMVHLAALGYSGVGVELSEQARREARARTQRFHDRLSVVPRLEEASGESP